MAYWLTKVKHKASKLSFAFALVLMDVLLIVLIITLVPYTKIDWDAYMSQVSGFLGGERDYRNLEGDTGPLVYPAGFLYIYSALQYLTGGKVYPAQILFGILYAINLSVVIFIYMKTNVVPCWGLCLLCLSKRVHSLFVLRLFNDCFAITLLHSSLASFLCQQWHLGLILFSVAVSIKMSVLLYAPPLLLLLLKSMNINGVISASSGAAIVQILLGLPFLITHPISYLSRAFNLGRVFIHFWSVNFKFVPETIFLSKSFAIALLLAHLGLLVIFAHYRWCRDEGGLLNLLRSTMVPIRLMLNPASSHKITSFRILDGDHILTPMFTGNFIGILCARSLHYQFYSWYFYSLPYLLWKTPYPSFVRLIIFFGTEFCWNVYPSHIYSSALLLFLHLAILWGLWCSPSRRLAHPFLAAGKKI